MNILQQQLDEYRRTDNGEVIQGSSHISKILNHRYRTKAVMNTYTHLNKLDLEYNAIACCGASGMLVVPQIAELLKKNIIIVRKKNDDRYSEFTVEGISPKNYIIIDDLICSGDTVRRIIKCIKEETPRARCLGVHTYIKDECAYRKISRYCKKDLGVEYL